MKKFILLFIAILSFSACSTTDDYGCQEVFINTKELPSLGYFDPRDLVVKQLGNHLGSIVITSEHEFQREVDGAEYYRNNIDFSRYDLIIGHEEVRGRNSKIITTLIEECNYKRQWVLEVEYFQNGTGPFELITFHSIIPKGGPYNIEVRPFIRNR